MTKLKFVPNSDPSIRFFSVDNFGDTVCCPIIAWRFNDSTPIPVPLEISLSRGVGDPDNRKEVGYFIELPESYNPNRWIAFDSKAFDDRDEAREYVRNKGIEYAD